MKTREELVAKVTDNFTKFKNATHIWVGEDAPKNSRFNLYTTDNYMYLVVTLYDKNKGKLYEPSAYVTTKNVKINLKYTDPRDFYTYGDKESIEDYLDDDPGVDAIFTPVIEEWDSHINDYAVFSIEDYYDTRSEMDYMPTIKAYAEEEGVSVEQVMQWLNNPSSGVHKSYRKYIRS